MGAREGFPQVELLDQWGDPLWRLGSGLYKIMDKYGKQIAFKPNAAQLELLHDMHYLNLVLKARQRGFCLDPATRVLTADLRWARIDSLKAGDEVVAVDEHVPGGKGAARRMRTATVQAAAQVHRKAYRITFDDGRSVVCTAQHPWLSRKVGTQADWRSIDGTGNHVTGRLKPGTRVRWVTTPWGDADFDDGWMGGMLDGEGSMALPHSSGAEVNVSQVQGPAFGKLEMYLSTRGYHYRTESDAAERPSKYGSQPVHKLCVSRMNEVFRLIGQTRPIRFIGRRFWEGKELPGKRNGGVGWSTIVSIEPMAEQTMIDLQTSTGTYIAEGFVSHNTTLIQLFILDQSLFNSNIRAGVSAHDRESAETFFRDKLKYAYDNLPDGLKEKRYPVGNKASELLFNNNSSIRVGVSLRSGTFQLLHISEFGKVCAKYPKTAKEVVTGTLQAIAPGNIVFIESTAEGREGIFYDYCREAEKILDEGREPNQMEYKLHFSSWWDADEYEIDPRGVVITDKDHEYFDSVEEKMQIRINMRKRAWWIMKQRQLGDKIFQEFPSTPEEAFRKDMAGCYYTNEFTAARKAGRILEFAAVDVPVNTFWDIGANDMNAIWFHQRVGMENRFIRYYENCGEPLAHYVKEMQKHGYVWGKHYLPHDAAHERLGESANLSAEQQLWNLGLKDTVIVPRVPEIIVGIQETRKAFPSAYFHRVDCAQGLERLENYKKEWDDRLGTYKDRPLHDINSNGADAFRQFGQVHEELAGGLPKRMKKRAGGKTI